MCKTSSSLAHDDIADGSKTHVGLGWQSCSELLGKRKLSDLASAPHSCASRQPPAAAAGRVAPPQALPLPLHSGCRLLLQRRVYC